MLLSIVVLFFACQPVHPTNATKASADRATQAPKESVKGQQTGSSDDFHGVKTMADIAKLSWVDKRCRVWGEDHDIDVDRTCLVARTVNGQLVVIPNPYNDEWLKETIKQLDGQTKDKWISRFYEIGGGEKYSK